MGLFSFFKKKVKDDPETIKSDRLPPIEEDEIRIDINMADVLLVDAAKLVVEHQVGSSSLIQKELKLGYNRTSRIIDQLEVLEVIGPFEGNDTRKVLVPDLFSLGPIIIENQHKLDEMDYLFSVDRQISPKYFNEISLGISKEELITIIGEPEKIEENVSLKKKTEKLYYGGDLNRMGSISYSRMIKLENDKVVGWKDL